MVTPQAIQEPELGLVPQMHAQPVASLFGDRRIFVNALQYIWHVQSAVGADKEARQHIVALARVYMNSVTVQKIVRWKYGTGWVA